jgi:hypothetical protein
MKRIIATLAALLFSASAFAALSAAQLPVFKAALLAETDAELVTYRDQGSTTLVAEWYNRAASPACTVWKSSVTQDEIMQNGFDWVQVDNLSVGKARIWEWLFDNQSTAINPSKANVRSGIDEAWKGTSAMLAVRTAIYVHTKRNTTKAEKLFATGLCTDASPSTLVFEGGITDYDVSAALSQ